MQPESENSWEFVYMRNVDTNRLTTCQVLEALTYLGIDTTQVASVSSIGTLMSEFIVRKIYIPEFVTKIKATNTPARSTLTIAQAIGYDPLRPYKSVLPDSCALPRRACRALKEYAQESVSKRWSSMYREATNEAVRAFIVESLKARSLDFESTQQTRPATAKHRAAGSLAHKRSPGISILSADHLAELIPAHAPKRLIVYADGAYLPHRKTAGIGVYFENTDMVPITDRLKGMQTNARAEVYAILLALKRVSEVVESGGEIWVCSDSRYAVDGINVHMEDWARRGWVNGRGRPVANRNAFREIYEIMKGIAGKCAVFVHYLPAHAGIEGNEVADMLAKAGALL